ncbi:MAG: arginine N-succinyltransferase [Bdellovibrionaceae bacterium]|nr:arginine N-succinyltransferase [Pseudobdellovibrionaceae bacterium]
MNFVIRSATHDDLPQLLELAKQFNLLNLPGDKKILSDKIDVSVKAFAGSLPKAKSEYLLVLEDLEEKLIVGSSLIMAKHGTDEIPHSYFKILKRNHFSQDLGIGFIHQVLRFQLDTDGPTEIGGLLVDKSYRRRPERLGKQISLSRFLYIALHPERFEERILCELTPPLTDEGRSEFWEALGRRFTGLNYQEADLLSQSHKEFIESLFPEDDIYLSLLDSKARTVLGRVGESTKPAQHLLESIGFEYIEEVDPFDGGPHFGCQTQDVLPIKQGRRLRVTEFKDAVYKDSHLVGNTHDDFRAALCRTDIRDDEVSIPSRSRDLLQIELGEEVFVAPFEYARRKEQT